MNPTYMKDFYLCTSHIGSSEWNSWLNVPNARRKSASPRKHGRWPAGKTRKAWELNWRLDSLNAAEKHLGPYWTRRKSDFSNTHPNASNSTFFSFKKVDVNQKAICVTLKSLLDTLTFGQNEDVNKPDVSGTIEMVLRCDNSLLGNHCDSHSILMLSDRKHWSNCRSNGIDRSGNRDAVAASLSLRYRIHPDPAENWSSKHPFWSEVPRRYLWRKKDPWKEHIYRWDSDYSEPASTEDTITCQASAELLWWWPTSKTAY